MTELSPLEIFKLSLKNKSNDDLDKLEKATARKMLATPAGTNIREKAIDTWMAVLDEISERS